MVRFQREGFKLISFGEVPFVLLFVMLKDAYLNIAFEAKSLNCVCFFIRFCFFLGINGSKTCSTSQFYAFETHDLINCTMFDLPVQNSDCTWFRVYPKFVSCNPISRNIHGS